MIAIDGLQVTELSDADQPAIDDLYARCADYVAIDPEAGPPDRLLHGLPDDAVPERFHCFGLWQDGVLQGTVAVLCGYREEKDWCIGLLMLDPKLRGRGVGHAAVEEVLRWGRASGIARALWIVVAPANVRGLAFWMREGFVEHSRDGKRIILSRAID